jgi:uncharacterized coiled-coil protein SlyX
MAEQHVDELEIKLAFQDKLIQDLDALVRAFGDRLDQLERELAQLREALRSPQLPLGGASEKPPHY